MDGPGARLRRHPLPQNLRMMPVHAPQTALGSKWPASRSGGIGVPPLGGGGVDCNPGRHSAVMELS